MGISKQSIEDLKKRSKISDFVLSTTTGKLRGTKGMALCPFHGEKTASMSFTDVENFSTLEPEKPIAPSASIRIEACSITILAFLVKFLLA